jgi:hypothetical protein
MEKSYQKLGYFLILLIPLTLVAFYKTYIGQFPNFEDKIDAFIHIHAFISVVWLFILIVQPFLIYKKKFLLHRKIGKLSYVVFPLLLLSFIPQIIKTARYGNINNLFFPLADSGLLITFYALAIYYRKESAKHMRYMIALSLVLLGPTVGRIGPIWLGWSEVLTQSVQYGIIYVVLISLLFYDLTENKRYFPYPIAMGCFMIHLAIFYYVFL